MYVVYLKENEIPRQTEKVMTKWKLLSFEDIQKLDLMPGIKKTISKLISLHSREALNFLKKSV